MDNIEKKLKTILNLSGNNFRDFNNITSGNNKIEGIISFARDHRLGALVIFKVNDIIVKPQIVWGMPKLHYPYINKQKRAVRFPPGKIRIEEKLDGTNITFYPLRDWTGKIIEVVAKTRLCPIVNNSFRDFKDMLNKILTRDNINIEKAVRDTGYSFSFEMYGKKNLHLVEYDNDLDLDLLCIIDNGKALPYDKQNEIAKKYKIKQVPLHFEEDEDNIYVTEYFKNKYKFNWNKRKYTKKSPLYHDIQKIYESINKINGKLITEGSVWSVSNSIEKIMFKCKEPSIEEIHMSMAMGIPEEIIIQSIHKGIENNILENIFDFVISDLLESYDYLVIQKLDEKIKKLSKELINEETIRKDIKNIISNIENKDIRSVMPILHKKYGTKKNAILFKIYKEVMENE